jgi:ABC-type uncharacterized transport system ATPase subunit
VRAYWEAAVCGYRRYAIYRGATFAGVFTNSVWGVMRGYVLLALLDARPHLGGYDRADTLTYVWMTQAMIMITFIWGWNDLALRIVSGDVAVDLCRPIDFQGYWLAGDLGRAFFHALFRGVPPLLLGALLFPLRIPIDPVTWLGFIYRVPAAVHRQRLAALRGLLDLDPFLETPVRQLSLGQRMRGELTAALLHGPEVLFLDEPTVGLDIVSKARVRDFLAELNRERGATVLLTTHDLSDIERLCPRMLIIDHGRVLYDGGTADIAARSGGERTLVVDLVETRPPLQLTHGSVVRTDGPRQWIRFRSQETSAAALISAVSDQAQVVDLSIEEPDIEEVVRRVYTGEVVPTP